MKFVNFVCEVREEPRPKSGSAEMLFQELKKKFDPLQERFYLIPFVGKEFDVVELFRGGVNSAVISPHTVFQRLLMAYPNCTNFAVAHNHPSGDVTPSSEDNAITKQLSMAGDVMNMACRDHIIFSDSEFYSYAGNDNIL